MKNNLRRNPSVVDKWLEEDGLMLIECWSRDGYTIEDIANKIGVNQKTLYDWRSQYPEIEEALRNGREIIDYKVKRRGLTEQQEKSWDFIRKNLK